jgi:hypothetical protein
VLKYHVCGSIQDNSFIGSGNAVYGQLYPDKRKTGYDINARKIRANSFCRKKVPIIPPNRNRTII